MKTLPRLLPLLAAAALYLGSTGPAAAITFTQVVDINTPLPPYNNAGLRNLLLYPPACDGGKIAFLARAEGTVMIFTNLPGYLVRVVDETIEMPTFGVVFDELAPPCMKDGIIAFYGHAFIDLERKKTVSGIYTWSHLAGMQTVVDAKSNVPGEHTVFTGFGPQPAVQGFTGLPSDADNSTVVFTGKWTVSVDESREGLFIREAGSIRRLADTRTRIPGGDGTFTSFGGVGISSGQVIFQATGSNGQSGIYLASEGRITRIADRRTLRPGKNTTFFSFNPNPDIYNQDFCFVSDGVYRARLTSGISTIADQSTPVPGSNSLFRGFLSDPTTDSGRIAFVGKTLDGFGIYYGNGSGLSILLDHNSQLDQRQIQEVGLGTNSLHHDKLAFSVRFTDGTSAIYMANGIDINNTPAATRFSRDQRLRIAGDGAYQELIYNYSTGVISVSPYSFAPGRVFFNLAAVNEWMGLFHYDYTSGRFSGLALNTWDRLGD